jgi:ribose transport system permease protein
MTAQATSSTPTKKPMTDQLVEILRRRGALIAFFLVCIFFGLAAPTFATPTNALNIVNQSVVLTVVAMAMTIVIISGGIDLSVAISLDFGAMGAIALLKAGFGWPVAIAGGLAFGTLVGAFNAFNIVKLGISPFLATLSVLFIGESVQRIYTRGGEPIYMAKMAEGYRFLGRGDIMGFPFDVILAGLVVLAMFLLIERTIHGKRWRAIGSQYDAAQSVGLRVELYTTLSYIISAFICAFAGILLSSSLSSYVPISGIFYLLDAIGATFIGTSIDKEGRPNILGTLLGVLLFGMVTNGLNLIGINFYWQAVARGALIFFALALATLNQQKRT